MVTLLFFCVRAYVCAGVQEVITFWCDLCVSAEAEQRFLDHFLRSRFAPLVIAAWRPLPAEKKQRTDNCSAVEFEDSSPVDCPKFDKLSDPTFKIHHFSFTHRIKSKVRVSKCCKSARQRLFRRNAISYKKIAWFNFLISICAVGFIHDTSLGLPKGSQAKEVLRSPMT